MDFAPLEKAGSRLGTGTFIVFSEDDCPVRGTPQPAALLRPRVVRLLHAVPRRASLSASRSSSGSRTGRGAHGDIELIDELYRNIGPNSFCAHAAGAAEPVKGLLAHFRPLLEEHVVTRSCPFARHAEPVHA